MEFYHKKTHQDQIWTYYNKTVAIQETLCNFIAMAGYTPVSTSKEWKYCQYDLPVVWSRGDQIISWRVQDSLFMEDTEAWTRPKPNIIISDNIALRPVAGHDITLFPEHMHVYYCQPEYIDREPAWMFNCFMNRISGDRNIVFYELIRRKLLDQGLVSFNCFRPGDNRDLDDLTNYTEKNYAWQYESADLGKRYSQEHEQGRQLIPYNNIEPAGLSLEQCIIDSCVSLILETYISSDHIIFSEKLFRALQLPRPWLMHCTPGAIKYLRDNGFDLLDDYVDHSYDQILEHHHRLYKIIDQLATFNDCEYTKQDYVRFNQAAKHNQQLILKFEQAWPAKFEQILKQIQEL